MNDELNQLRVVVRAVVAERHAYAIWSERVDAKIWSDDQPTPESIQEMRRLSNNIALHKQATDAALAKLAQIAPELVVLPPELGESISVEDF
jgi:hypothetical protein